MATDDLQIVLRARDQLSDDVKAATNSVERLERALRGASNATSPEAARDVERLSRELDQAYRDAKQLSTAAASLDRDLDKLGASAASAGRKTQGLGRDMSGAHRSGSSLVAGWGKMAGVAAGVTAGIAAMGGAFRFLSDSVNEARTARKAMAQTAAVMRSMGRTEAPKRIDKMIDQLERASGIDGDEIRQMTNLMFTFGEVTGKTFAKANELALDVSVSFGKDLSSSAVMVGKALNDPVKGLTALGRIGVQFTQQQQDQIKAMMAVNDVAGAQGIILGELERQVGGSAKAQADGIAKAQVAWGNLKEAIGDVLMATFSGGGLDLVRVLRKITKWIGAHKEEIVSFLQLIVSAVYKVISVWLKWQSIVLKSYGYILGGLSKVLSAMALLDPRLQGAADRAESLADGFGQASKAANDASKFFDGLADSTGKSARETGKLKDALDNVGVAVDQLNGKQVRNLLRDTPIPGVNRQGGIPAGDTAAAVGAGYLGPGGLAAAHAGYSSALAGHRITSGVRGHSLGSAQSDHLRGRAMDVQGPRLGAYAQVVRKSGGYAAMHGAGGNRHLHVVPQRRGGGSQVQAGGNSFVAHVTVNNPSAPMDIQAAVSRGLRAAAREQSERG